MRATLSSYSLAAGLQRLEAIAAAAVQVTAEAGRVTLSATNVDTRLTLTMPAKVDDEGSAAVPLAVLPKLLSLWPSDTVTIATDGEALRFEGASGWHSVAMVTVEAEQPICVRPERAVRIEVGNDELATALCIVVDVAATEASETLYWKHSLTGAYLHERDGRLVVVATDGHRLARVRTWITVPKGWPSVFVPRTAIRAWLWRGHEGATMLSIDQLAAELTTEGATLTTRLLDGKYPDYERFTLLDKFEHSLVVPADHLAAAARRFALLDKAAVALVPEDGAVRLRMEYPFGPLAWAGVETLDAMALASGRACPITFGAAYLRQSMRHFAGEQVRISWNDAESPVRIEAADSDGAILHILMPVRTER